MARPESPRADQNIKVAIRVRANLQESNSCVKVLSSPDSKSASLKITDKRASKEFTFDEIFHKQDTDTIYSSLLQPLVLKSLNGFNATVFAYGQTSSGKTYTMEGKEKSPGLITQAIAQICKHPLSNHESSYKFYLSYLEIYQEAMRDLLVDEGEQAELKIRMNPDDLKDLYVQGLTERAVFSEDEFHRALKIGAKRRCVGSTNMNETSSRSHAIVIIRIEQTLVSSGARKRSKLHLIDLAGSENVRSTGAEGTRLKEGASINQSLSCLGNVINALTTKATYVPYRESKLTYLLSDSLAGNSITCLIACIHPLYADESTSTLRFAERVKKVVNHARVNIDAKSRRILELQDEVERLKAQLANCTCRQSQPENEIAVPTGKRKWWANLFRIFARKK